MLNILSNAIKYTSSSESIFVDIYDKNDILVERIHMEFSDIYSD